MRRELKHKIAYLKLGPTDKIYTYDFDKELSFLQFNSNTRKNTWAIYCWNNNCGFVDVCCWHHNDHKKKSSNIGNLSWKKFVFSHPIHRAGVFFELFISMFIFYRLIDFCIQLRCHWHAIPNIARDNLSIWNWQIFTTLKCVPSQTF